MLLRHSTAGPQHRSRVAMRVLPLQKKHACSRLIPRFPVAVPDVQSCWAASDWSGLDRLGCGGDGAECALLREAGDAGSWMGEVATCRRFL